jgi:hypothetical protein
MPAGERVRADAAEIERLERSRHAGPSLHGRLRRLPVARVAVAGGAARRGSRAPA